LLWQLRAEARRLADPTTSYTSLGMPTLAGPGPQEGKDAGDQQPETSPPGSDAGVSHRGSDAVKPRRSLDSGMSRRRSTASSDGRRSQMCEEVESELASIRSEQATAVKEVLQREDAEKRKMMCGGCMRLAGMHMVVALGLVAVVISLAVGVGMAQAELNTGTYESPSMCQLEQAGAKPLLAANPWELETPQWVFGVVNFILLVLRKWVFPPVVEYMYPDLTDDKKDKLCNYMLEIIGTTVSFVMIFCVGTWELILNPSKFEDRTQVSKDELYNLSVGVQLSFTIGLSMYAMEIAFDKNMRFELIVHHILGITLGLSCLVMFAVAGHDLMLARMFIATGFYLTTEQNVFVTMLMYYRKVYLGKVFVLSAWYYLLTRMGFSLVVLWAWWGARDAVFSVNRHNNVIVYSLWLLYPTCNLMFNATQLLTVKSLFGIAKKVKTLGAKKSMGQIQEVFDAMDEDGSGVVSHRAFTMYLQKTMPKLGVPLVAFGWTFEAIDIARTGEVSSEQFRAHLEPMMREGRADVVAALKACVLKACIDKGACSIMDREAYSAKVHELLSRGEGDEFGHRFSSLARDLIFDVGQPLEEEPEEAKEEATPAALEEAAEVAPSEVEVPSV